MTDADRKALWEKIQQHEPKLAELMKAIQRNFGKVTIHKIEFINR